MTSNATIAPADLARAALWRTIVIAGAIAFTLRTAWDVWSIRPDYERVVLRNGIPPVYALVILAAALIRIFSAYIAAASLWLRRRWAPRIMVWYGLAVAMTSIGVRSYFTRGHDVALFTGDEWTLMASLVVVIIAAAFLVDRALEVLPASAPESVAVPRWENWLTVAAAIPPIAFAARS
ncbi:MAG TPA: hypothetical protein VHV78_05285 [Gemmatimonadaceae bacterium]|nr:hypothetical protein [Gemmatimonadaceae bacterium]